MFRNAGTYSSKYCKHLWKVFLCLKNGDKLQTSSSFNVWSPADLKIGSMYEKLVHCQRLAASSGLVSSSEDGCAHIIVLGKDVYLEWNFSLHRPVQR